MAKERSKVVDYLVYLMVRFLVCVLQALPFVLIFLPASWVVARTTSIPVKVVSSWVIAVAVLAATLQLLPVTPGYLPDHLE